MGELINVPSFIFEQGDIFSEEINSERPIHVQYYNSTITLVQNGNEILISDDWMDAFFKAVKKNKIEADKLIK